MESKYRLMRLGTGKIHCYYKKKSLCRLGGYILWGAGEEVSKGKISCKVCLKKAKEIHFEMLQISKHMRDYF